MLWKDLIITRPKRSNFVKVKRDSKLILAENITSINTFAIIVLYFVAYLGLDSSVSKSYADAAGKAIKNGGGYMLIFLLLLSFSLFFNPQFTKIKLKFTMIRF